MTSQFVFPGLEPDTVVRWPKTVLPSAPVSDDGRFPELLRGLRSTAVMSRRHEPADSLDFFPTPPWATRAFVNSANFLFDWASGPTCLDPCCGEGHMALVLEEYAFSRIFRSDIHDYGQSVICDFLHMNSPGIDWVFMNPPFNKAAAFIRHGLTICRKGVCCLVRTAFLEGRDRYARLYHPTPAAHVFQYVERVPMHKGRYVINGSSATSYCWIVWAKETPDFTRLHHIPPSREKLFRMDDILRFGACTDVPQMKEKAENHG